MTPLDLEELVAFLTRELARGRDEDVRTASLIDAGIVDSVGIMKLVAFLERRFALRIGDDELLPDNFETLAAIVALVDRKRSG